MSETGRLIITDGDVVVSLFDIFNLQRWTPALAGTKAGGVWASSPFMPGRRLVAREFDNVTDSLELTIKSEGDINDLIFELRKLRQLLEKAVDYWVSDWAKEPVWIEARGTCEDEIRYAYVIDYRTPKDDDPYEDYANTIPSIFENFPLTIEHLQWQETEPDTETAIELSTSMTYNGTDYGQEATTERDVYLANKYTEANITHGYIYDASVPGFLAGNLIGGALPQNLLPNPPAVGDMLYLGINTALADSGPFSNVIFDLSQRWSVFPNWGTAVWEYWNGAWIALNPMDNTFGDGDMTPATSSPLSTLGVNAVAWAHPADWVTTAVNGVTGYWIRLRITVTPPIANNVPIQQNRDIYSQTYPWVDLDELQIPGDLPALIHTIIENRSAEIPNAIQDDNYTEMFMLCSRSVSRDFVNIFPAYINFSDEQNITGVTVGESVASSAFANDVQSPTGRCITSTLGGAVVEVETAYAIVQELFPGTYRVFLRADITTGTADAAKWKLRFDLGDYVLFETEFLEFVDTGQYAYIDFGQVDLLSYSLARAYGPIIYVISDDAAAQVVNLYDLVIMPVDEFSLLAYTNNGMILGSRIEFYGVSSEIELNVDSVTFQKNPVKAYARAPVVGTSLLLGDWILIINNLHILQQGEDQRIYFFGINDKTNRNALAWQLVRMEMSRSARYLSMRGDS